jgi:S-adenosyl-L-methionine hydrolase (adenosine-forming)
MASGVITLLTDFGTADAFVGIMKGVILGINPRAQLVDLTHAVPPQQILPAALVLRSAVRFFPAGTVHVAVVDPGVGSARRAIMIETEHGFLVGPDNGVLSLAAAVRPRGESRVIENRALFRQPVSQTFHGRDIFAPAAAHLSCGVQADVLGPRTDSIVDLQLPAVHDTPSGLRGEVIYVDHFGNLLTNIDADISARFPAQRLSVSIDGKPVAGPLNAYAAVPAGMALAIVSSWGTLEIAVRNGNAAQTFAAGPGTPVTVVVESRDA